MVATTRLLDLQALDLAIDRLEARSRALQAGEDLVAARKAADEAETALGELRLRLDEMNRDASKLEHEIDSLAQKASAEERRLFDGSVANPKELGSIRQEVDNLRKRKSDREDELLALMEQREALEREIEAARASADELRSQADRIAGESGSELSRVAGELEAKRAERAEVALAIDPELLDLYESLRAQKKGIGAVALIDGVCQGCHEQLSAVELDKVKHTEDIPRCEYCRRILVL